MNDFFSDLEDQLGGATVSGAHLRRSAMPRPLTVGGRALAATGCVLVVLAVVLAATLTGARVRPGARTGARGPAAPHRALGRSRAGASHRPLGHSRAGARCVSVPSHRDTPCVRNGFSVPRGDANPFPRAPRGAVYLVAQVNLTGAARTRAVGLAEVIRYRGAYGITIDAASLPANTRHDAYAVWLAGARGIGPRLLGFVDPPVGRDGRLRTAGSLPSHPLGYHRLLVTLETTHAPRRPGRVVLSGPLP